MATVQFDVGHPAHVHLFKYVAQALIARGDTVIWSVIEREMILDLLDSLGMPYEVIYRRHPSKVNLWQEVPMRTINTLKVARKYKSDLLISMANPTVGLPALLLGKPYIAMTDTEPAYNQLATARPFAKRILTPASFFKDLGDKQHRYNGTHELAYLHPDLYTPDASIYDALGIPAGSPYSVVRFVAWNATHDAFERGLSQADKRQVIQTLSQYGAVVLSTEDASSIDIDGVITTYPLDRMHDILAFASIYVGEGNTMAAEAATLGTPAIRANTMDNGYCRYLQSLGLMVQSTDGNDILSNMNRLLYDTQAQQHIVQAHEQFLSETVPVRDVILQHIDDLLT